ncbi:MAG: response regulator [Motiliproteus sp.]|nr:response regulator [Motiliproteus sp.]MCW9051309.1 response regulator [Motiliproteus sp.]
MRKPLHRLLIATHQNNCREAIIKVAQNHLEEAELYKAESLQQCLKLIEEITPDMLMLDLNLPDGEGVKTLQQLCSTLPETAVVVLGNEQDAETAAAIMANGAAGFILSSLENDPLADALEQVLDGQVYLPNN